MAVAKKCIGCQSNKRSGDISYNQCKDYIGDFRDIKLHALFRNDYCPCIECLVKATCTDPKISKFGYTIASVKHTGHKCPIFRKQVDEYKQYLKRNRLNVLSSSIMRIFSESL